MCEAIEKQAEGNTEIAATQDTERMQKLCWGSEFSQHVLSRITETFKAYI